MALITRKNYKLNDNSTGDGGIALDQNFTRLGDDVEAINNELQVKGQQIDELTAAVENVQIVADDATSVNVTQNGNIENLSNTVEVHSTQINTLDGNIENVSNTVQNQGTQIDTLDSSISTLNDNLANKADANDVYTKAEDDTLLAAKANTSHTHAESDITNLVSDLAAKANSSSLGDMATKNAGITTGSGVVVESGNKINQALLPAVAIVDFLGQVASQAAMLALTGQKGDWCIRTDTAGGSSTWLIIGSDPTQLSSWQQLANPSAVTSVNTLTGAVTLSAANVGAYTTAQVDTIAAGKANTTHTHAEADVTNLVTDLANKANLNSTNTFQVTPQTIHVDNASHVGLVIKQQSSQTANPLEIQNNANGVIASINHMGQIACTDLSCGDILANQIEATSGFIGNGAALTNLPAGNLTGSIDDARLSSNVPLKSGTNTFVGNLTAPTFIGAVTGTASGNLTSASSLPAANLTGTVVDARLSSNVPLKTGTNTFVGNLTAPTFVGAVTGTASGNPPNARTLTTTSPLSGGGDLSSNRTLAISAATTSAAGSMSAADKTKLDNATDALANSTIVMRDSSAGFSANDIIASSLTTQYYVTFAGNSSPTVGQMFYFDGFTFQDIDSNLKSIYCDGCNANYFYGDGSNLYNLPIGNPFDQTLNTGDSVAFNEVTANAFIGDGSQLTGLPDSGVPTTRNINTTAPITGGGALSGDLTIAISASTGSVAGSMSAAHFALVNGATNANTASTIVKRDASGGASFGTLVASLLTGTASGNLTSASSLDATKLINAIADARLSSNVPLKTGTNTFVGTLTAPTFIGAVTGTASGNLTSLAGVVVETGCVFDGGGGVITGTNTAYKRIEANSTIAGYTVLADVSGSLTCTLKKSTYSGFPTTSDITGTHNIVLSSAQKSTDTTLTGWTTAVTAGDILEFAISGTPTSVNRATVSLKLVRT